MRIKHIQIPDYVVDRLRRGVSEGCSVVPHSTPVLAFGDPTVAKIDTLGLNPSRVEFLGRDGLELSDADAKPIGQL